MDSETSRIAGRFAMRIKKAYAPARVLLFGSRARGNNFKKSDFDFIIVSRKFSGVRFVERPAGIYGYWDEAVDIDAVCFTPEEFERKSRQYGTVRNAVGE